MTAVAFARSKDRGVIAITGAGAAAWLDGLVTNDLSPLAPGRAVFAALLSPQGKILFEFFVVRAPDGVLLDTHAASVAALVKRLGLYKLRAPVVIADVSAHWSSVWAARATDSEPAHSGSGLTYPDPRAPAVAWRGLVPMPAGAALPIVDDADLRVAHGIAAAPGDYALGDTFPHEANYDLCDGVSFTKGCYIGQEVVSRMQNKAVVRKRVVRVTAAGDALLVPGSAITTGAATIGAIGTSTGAAALAMLRLDRVAEALAGGQAVACDGHALTVDAAAIERYRQSAANRPVIDL